MSTGRATLSISSAVPLGVGTMIGAGIFALLGKAGTMAGSAVWISFLAVDAAPRTPRAQNEGV